MEQRLIAASLRAMLADQAMAEFIDLSDETTIAGVQYLAQVGLLTEERAQEVLTNTQIGDLSYEASNL